LRPLSPTPRLLPSVARVRGPPPFVPRDVAPLNFLNFDQISPQGSLLGVVSPVPRVTRFGGSVPPPIAPSAPPPTIKPVWGSSSSEFHSKRHRLKLHLHREVLHIIVLEQTHPIGFVVRDCLCDSCSRTHAKPDQAGRADGVDQDATGTAQTVHTHGAVAIGRVVLRHYCFERESKPLEPALELKVASRSNQDAGVMMADDPGTAAIDRGNGLAATDRGPAVATEHGLLLPFPNVGLDSGSNAHGGTRTVVSEYQVVINTMETGWIVLKLLLN
jgi:hypothetical protein